MRHLSFTLDWQTYYLLMFAVLAFTLWAQFQVQSAFKKYNQVSNARYLTGADAARRILDANGLYHVQIEHISGRLSDHYDPRANVIRLSDAVYQTSSIAAVGVAAHEAGHAVQYATGYAPVKLRTAILPVTQFASGTSIFLFFIGFLFSQPLALLGFALYLVVAFFQFVTLPVEFNASARALQTLDGLGILDNEELNGAKKVLRAAAMTYVAAMAVSLLQMLRMILLLNSRNNRR